MKRMKANAFIADELEHKLQIISKALEQAHDIITKLEEENKRLISVLDKISQKS